MGSLCPVRAILVGSCVFWVATLGMLSLSTSGIRTFRGCSHHVFGSCGIHVECTCSCGSSILVFVGCGISINSSLWHTGVICFQPRLRVRGFQQGAVQWDLSVERYADLTD